MSIIQDINEEALEILLKFHEENNNFKFSLRKNKDKKDRLNSGYWFQGSNYVFISPYKKGDSNNKTKSIGFVVNDKK